MALDWNTIIFAFLLGNGTFFSPCSVALIPAYVGYFIGFQTEKEQGVHATRSVRTGLLFGGTASMSVVAVFAVAGILVYGLRSVLDVDSLLLLRVFAIGGIGVAFVVITLGVLMIAGRSPSFTLALRAPSSKSVLGMASFGVLYALASLGCTLPLFIAVIGLVLTETAAAAFFIVLTYGIGLGGLLFAAILALTVAQEAAARWIRKAMPFVRPISGVILILAGLYVILYYGWLAPAW